MESARQTFHLGYRWELEGAIEDAFYAVSHIATWPEWWPQILAVETEEPTRPDVRVGDSAVMQAKSWLPYRLDWHTVVRRIEPPRLIEVTSRVTLAGRFEMTGVVAFELEQAGRSLTIVNRQEMVSSTPIPRLLRPLASALFNFNHDYAMKRGLPGLQRRLRAGLHQEAVPVANLERS